MMYSFNWYDGDLDKWLRVTTEDRREAVMYFRWLKDMHKGGMNTHSWSMFLHGAKRFTVGYEAPGFFYSHDYYGWHVTKL